jgi:antitoxin component of MazEF toxin-antitoxin module
MPTFKTAIMQAGDINATGVVVPEEVVAKLGQGKKPKVDVSFKGNSYRSTIHVMGAKSLLPLAEEHREKAGVKGGDKVEVTLEVDAALHEVEVPKDLVAALK